MKGDPILTGRGQQKDALCSCGHPRSQHAAEMIGWFKCGVAGCDCEEFSA